MRASHFFNKFLHRRHVEPTEDQDPSDIKLAEKKKNKKQQNVHLQKFLHDPMRNTNTPDTLGSFYDPMAIHRHGRMVTMNYDITNTGA